VTGVTIGATYALVALGFSIIFNASHVINFAQGEFVMLGGMSAVFLLASGIPLPAAVLLAVLCGAVLGIALYKLGIAPARHSDPIPLIIITIGAGLALRGIAQIVWGKGFHSLPAFSGNEPIGLLGAVIMPQSLWVVGTTCVVVALLAYFFNRTRLGKAILATSYNRDAAQLMGINTDMIMVVSFALAGLLGAVAGAVVAPITFTYYEIGVMLGLKGFVAAVLGGLGSFPGAVAGGLVLGVTEAMMAGYISSHYKDAVAFVLILLILFFMPTGMFGKQSAERV
jgi:branched-chain amino acid transport system permease protein